MWWHTPTMPVLWEVKADRCWYSWPTSLEKPDYTWNCLGAEMDQFVFLNPVLTGYTGLWHLWRREVREGWEEENKCCCNTWKAYFNVIPPCISSSDTNLVTYYHPCLKGDSQSLCDLYQGHQVVWCRCWSWVAFYLSSCRAFTHSFYHPWCLKD